MELAEARMRLERELAELSRAHAELEGDRAALAADAERLAAANIAAEQAEGALARSSLAPQKRPKLARAEVAAAAEALLARAELVVLALSALPADAESVARVQKLLSSARSELASKPDVALERADRALYAALAVLGPLRKARVPPSPAEAGALAEALQQAGARVARNDRGLAAVLSGPDAALTKQLTRVCALARAYPHGLVRATARVSSEQAALSRKEALGRALAGAGCAGERFGVDVGVGRARDLELTWLAY